MDFEFIGILETLKDDAPSAAPRPDFVERVMRAVAYGPAPSRSRNFRFDDFLRMFAVPARAAALSAVAVAAVATFVVLSPARRSREVSFRVDMPGASSVAVTGDFNGWEMPGMALTADRKGGWSRRVKLPPGRYRYVLVVDGNLVSDPSAAESVPDGFGNKNAIIDTERPSIRM